MERTFSNEFKKYFLLVLTKELIVHSAKVDMIKLENIIASKERKETKPILSQKRFPIEKGRVEIKKEIRRISPSTSRRQMVKSVRNPIFNIPVQQLPSHLEYLKPLPAPVIEIDLYKLNHLLQDPAVKSIIGNPDEKVSVVVPVGTRRTNIVLSKEDIDRIINVFSEKSKIPVTEGIYKVVVGNLTLSAIISQVIGPRFIIKKN
jgi:hypothetical protein